MCISAILLYHLVHCWFGNTCIFLRNVLRSIVMIEQINMQNIVVIDVWVPTKMTTIVALKKGRPFELMQTKIEAIGWA